MRGRGVLFVLSVVLSMCGSRADPPTPSQSPLDAITAAPRCIDIVEVGKHFDVATKALGGVGNAIKKLDVNGIARDLRTAATEMSTISRLTTDYPTISSESTTVSIALFGAAKSFQNYQVATGSAQMDEASTHIGRMWEAMKDDPPNNC